MQVRVIALLGVVVGLTACAQAAQPVAPKTDDEKALYGLGVILSRNVQSFNFSEQELKMLQAGVSDGALDKSKLKPDELEALIPKLQELQTQRAKIATEKEKAAGTAYLAKTATAAGVTKTASGLLYKSTTEGSGAAPVASDTVKVHYTGKFVDGKVFDSSVERKEPATFPLNGVVPCWTEGLQLMKVGGKAQLTCPPELAYGEEGRPPSMRGGATLIFDVELLEIVKAETGAAGAGAEAPASPQ